MNVLNDQPASLMEREFLFGPFRFIPTQKLLFYREKPLRVGGRALAILMVLVDRAGELISKEELISLAWPNTVVDDGNLKVHIAALRRALDCGNQGNCYIVNLSGRGYRFVAPVTCRLADAWRTHDHHAFMPTHNLPAPASRMLGRTATMTSLLQALREHRIVSIVGAGGIGKTTLALSLAESFHAQNGINICFVDLSPLSDAQFVEGALSTALGMTIQSHDGTQELIASLRGRRLLLVLDSCEHVIEATAVLVARIVSGAPGVMVLATSREPLRTTGELVHRLAPLDYPAAGRQITTAQQALAYPAIELFAERASECLEGYQLADTDAPAVAEICRRLEGIALAIELAAMRIDAFGARELLARLDDRFRLLRRGQRSAQSRHSTLAAALDWSYAFLPEEARLLLRRLSVFSGAFSLDAVIGLFPGTEESSAMVVDAVTDLVDKSMLSADVSGPAVYYRLPDTTKAYALDKLEQSGEMDAMRRRHAQYQHARFYCAAQQWGKHPGAQWLASHGRGLDDVRSALAWAFSPSGDSAIGIALTVAAIPLWMELWLLEECRQRVERALASKPALASDEMKLHAARAVAILYTHGPVDETSRAWTRVLALADALGDREYQLYSLWGMAVHRSYAGATSAVLALAERVRAMASGQGERTTLDSLERLIATAEHYGGDQAAARIRLEQMLSRYVAPKQRLAMARFQPEQRSAALGTLANVLWLQGYPDQAARTIRTALQEARGAEHALSLLNVLAHAAFPVMLHAGDDAAVGRLLDELAGHLGQLALPLWDLLLVCLRGVFRVHRGDLAGLAPLHDALDALQGAGFRLRLSGYMGTLAAALGMHGRHNEGLAIVDEALSACDAGGERWCYAELLRIKGELLVSGDAAAAERHFRQAMAMARRQGALSWELRAASSLARLPYHQHATRQHATQDARQVLASVYDRFSEGFATADLRLARALLEDAGALPGNAPHA